MASVTRVGAYEAKTKLPALLAALARGREIVITRHERPVARLLPVGAAAQVDLTVFQRIRALRARVRLASGESTKDLVEQGRRGASLATTGARLAAAARACGVPLLA